MIGSRGGRESDVVQTLKHKTGSRSLLRIMLKTEVADHRIVARGQLISLWSTLWSTLCLLD